MVYYPINLNLNGKKVVVIGGGRIAERKNSGVDGGKADITVISPKLTLELKEYAKRVKLLGRKRTLLLRIFKTLFLLLQPPISQKSIFLFKRQLNPISSLVWWIIQKSPILFFLLL